MPTPRIRPVLFEVAKRSRPLSATGWRAPPPAKPQPRPDADKASADSGKPASRAPFAPPTMADDLTPRQRWLQLGERHVRITLSPVAAAAVCAGLLALLAVAYVTGRVAGSRTGSPDLSRPPSAATQPAGVPITPPESVRTPPRSATDPRRDDSAGAAPPKPDDSAQRDARNNAEPTKPEPASASTAELRKGYHYLIVQHFRKSESDAAQAAARFLLDNGVPCAINRGEDVRLVALEPFLLNQKDAKLRAAEQARADELIRKVKELGKQYSRVSGYSFQLCTLRENK